MAVIDVVMVMYCGICKSNVYWSMKAFLFPLCSSFSPFFSPGSNDIWRYNILSGDSCALSSLSLV